MEFPVKAGISSHHKTSCAIVPLFDERRLSGIAKDLDSASGGVISEAVRSGVASAKPGKTLLLAPARKTAARRLLLVGCGPRDKFTAKTLATATTAATALLRDTRIADAVSYLPYQTSLDPYYAARLTVETVRSTVYRFDELKSQVEPHGKLSKVGIATADRDQVEAVRRGVRDGIAIANGVELAKNLSNRPPNVCTPSHLAEAARALAKRHRKITAKVLGESDIKRLGMGALLSVTSGAAEPARLIVLEYRGAPAASRPIALCGKGVTFDTGGISLKPPPKMDEMKFDMCGAASVLGTFAACGELEPKVNVVGIIPACENMPSGTATRPGDIVKSMSGQTVEILNTDAEGRLILCDALTYAQRFEPRCLIDVATLTGACIIALGHHYTGVFGNHDALVGELMAAGERALDAGWRLPVGEEYGESLKSNFADFANSGSTRRRRQHRGQLLVPFRRPLPLGASRHRGHRLAFRCRQRCDRTPGPHARPTTFCSSPAIPSDPDRFLHPADRLGRAASQSCLPPRGESVASETARFPVSCFGGRGAAAR